MGIIRVSSHALRQLSAGKTSCQSYAHTSPPVCKLQPPGVIGQVENMSSGWALPAALALVGLGLSTFSTQKMISGCDTIKMLPSDTTSN